MNSKKILHLEGLAVMILALSLVLSAPVLAQASDDDGRDEIAGNEDAAHEAEAAAHADEADAAAHDVENEDDIAAHAAENEDEAGAHVAGNEDEDGAHASGNEDEDGAHVAEDEDEDEDGVHAARGEKLDEGDLVRTPDKKIFVIKGGKADLVPNLEALRKFAGRPIMDVAAREIAEAAAHAPEIDETEAAHAPEAVGAEAGRKASGKKLNEGALVRTPDKKIFVVQDGEPMLVPNLKALHKYAGRPIADIAHADLHAAAPAQAAVAAHAPETGLAAKAHAGAEIGEGALIRTPDWKIFVVEKGKAVHIADPEELKKFPGKEIVNVPAETLDEVNADEI